MAAPRLSYARQGVAATLANESAREATRELQTDARLDVARFRFASFSNLAETVVVTAARKSEINEVRWSQDVDLAASSTNYHVVNVWRRRNGGDQTLLFRFKSDGGLKKYMAYSFSDVGGRSLEKGDVITFSSTVAGAPAAFGAGVLEVEIVRRDYAPA